MSFLGLYLVIVQIIGAASLALLTIGVLYLLFGFGLEALAAWVERRFK